MSCLCYQHSVFFPQFHPKFPIVNFQQKELFFQNGKAITLPLIGFQQPHCSLSIKAKVVPLFLLNPCPATLSLEHNFPSTVSSRCSPITTSLSGHVQWLLLYTKQSFQRWFLPHCFVFTHFPSFHLNNTSQVPVFSTNLHSFIFLQHLYNLAYYHLTHLFIICHHQENLNHRKTEIHLFDDHIANVKHIWHVELKYFLKKYIIVTIELIYR